MMKRFIVCCLFTLICCGSYAQHWDINLAKRINPDNPNSLLMRFASGSAYFVSALVPVSILTERAMSKHPSFGRNAVSAFGPIIIEVIISESMKDIIGRKRPAESFPGLIAPYRDVTGRSFPSGHTSLAFATAATLAIRYKKWYITIPAYSYAALVGYSRVYLGVHYPSDVIAGSIVGIGCAYLSNWLTQKVFGKKGKPHPLPSINKP